MTVTLITGRDTGGYVSFNPHDVAAKPFYYIAQGCEVFRFLKLKETPPKDVPLSLYPPSLVEVPKYAELPSVLLVPLSVKVGSGIGFAAILSILLYGLSTATNIIEKMEVILIGMVFLWIWGSVYQWIKRERGWR